MDVSRRRLRCIGHVINLVVRAVIFGSNVSKFEAELRGATDEFKFDIWAKKGAIGRLHNIATYITDQGSSAFADRARWNSIYMMIKRALELRCAIELYQSRWQKPKNDPDHRDLTNDFLNAGDWVELERFYEFLKPFYILTKTIEGNATLALHPSYGYDYFERHWKKAMNKPQWYSDMQSAVGSLFDEYRRQTEVETQAQAGFLEDESEEVDADNDYSSFGKR
ncbi:reverse transcriptase (RNA-dependent DNA polymerase) [Hirsutella rhossiliensis]